MHFIKTIIIIISALFLQACVSKGLNPNDPYEKTNRNIYAFNAKIDKYFLKPPAEIYVKVLPSRVRAGINNVYNNVNLLPTFANDILQADWNYVIKDFWRFVINTTIGIGGIFDPASTFSLPPHSNDLGLTFAKWGDKKSPFIMLPFLGPSTIRDGMGLLFDCIFFSPYPYLPSDTLIYSVLALRYVDLRSQMLDTDKLIQLSLDKYAFIRDAYLQHRNHLINNGEPNATNNLYIEDEEQQNTNNLYIDEEESPNKKDDILPEEPANGTPSQFPLTTAKNGKNQISAS